MLRELCPPLLLLFFFFFTDTATTEIYTLSLHDALPICVHLLGRAGPQARPHQAAIVRPGHGRPVPRRGQVARRSEEHTSELQSHSDLVCRLLLEKKKKIHNVNLASPLCSRLY